MKPAWHAVPRSLWSGLVLGLPLAAGWDADGEDEGPLDEGAHPAWPGELELARDAVAGPATRRSL